MQLLKFLLPSLCLISFAHADVITFNFDVASHNFDGLASGSVTGSQSGSTSGIILKLDAQPNAGTLRVSAGNGLGVDSPIAFGSDDNGDLLDPIIVPSGSSTPTVGEHVTFTIGTGTGSAALDTLELTSFELTNFTSGETFRFAGTDFGQSLHSPNLSLTLGDSFGIQQVNGAFGIGSLTFTATSMSGAAVPEPSSVLGLLAMGGAGLVWRRRRQNQTTA